MRLSAVHYFTRQTGFESVWRTPPGDSGQQVHPAPENLGTAFYAFLFNWILRSLKAAVEEGTHTKKQYLSNLPALDVLAKLPIGLDLLRVPTPHHLCVFAGIMSIDEDSIDFDVLSENELIYDAAQTTNSFTEYMVLTANHRQTIGNSSVRLKGHVGLGPRSIQLGDMICTVAGTRARFVIWSTSKSDTQPTYAFAGDAYVHDIMHSEALGGTNSGCERTTVV